MKKNNTLKFGEIVDGYEIPVLNEREIRAAAGLLFLGTFLSLLFILFKGNFVPIKYVIILFLTDFAIRVFISPRYAPSLVLGRLIVRNQNPEYVGAAQKKFAWIIGVALALTMFVLMVVLNSYSPISGIICLFCLIFLFFESAFGICLGCKFYPMFTKNEVKYCPGEVCDVKSKHPIQKTTIGQLLMVVGFIGLTVAMVYLFNDAFGVTPHSLFGE